MGGQLDINLGELSDEALMLSVRGGDDRAFGELERRYESVVFDYVYRHIGVRVSSERLVKEVFASVYMDRCSYSIGDNFSKFIFRRAFRLSYRVLSCRFI